MAANVITTPDAEQDIADAADWYAQDRPGREVKFLARVDECMTTIGRVPRGGRPLRANYRQVVIRHFPYIVVYIYDDATDTVTVHAVSHTSQDPQKLSDRFP